MSEGNDNFLPFVLLALHAYDDMGRAESLYGLHTENGSLEDVVREVYQSLVACYPISARGQAALVSALRMHPA